MKTNKKERICHICGEPCRSKSHFLKHPQCLDKPGRHGKLLTQTRIDFLCFNFPMLKNKDDLKYKYEVEQWSLPMLCKYVGGLDLKAMYFILTQYGVQIRTLQEARSKNSKSQQRIVDTCLKKYGKTNVLSKGTSVFDKKVKTIQDKYGVDNIWQCIDLFVGEHSEKNKKISSLNLIIEQLLVELNLPYKMEFCISYINFNDQKRHRKFYDFKILETNILIEANGEYWHADPRKYKKDQLITVKGCTIPVEILWQSDQFKINLAKENNYVVLTFWEKEIRDIKQHDWIKSEILRTINTERNKNEL